MTLFLLAFPRDVPVAYVTDGRVVRYRDGAPPRESEVVDDATPKVHFHPGFPSFAIFSSGSVATSAILFDHLNTMEMLTRISNQSEMIRKGLLRLRCFDPGWNFQTVGNLMSRLDRHTYRMQREMGWRGANLSLLVSVEGKARAMSRIVVLPAEHDPDSRDGTFCSGYLYFPAMESFDFPVATGGTNRSANNKLLEWGIRASLPTQSQQMKQLMVYLIDSAGSSESNAVGGTTFVGTLSEGTSVVPGTEVTKEGPFPLSGKDLEIAVSEGAKLFAEAMRKKVSATETCLEGIVSSLGDPDVLRRGAQIRVLARGTTRSPSDVFAEAFSMLKTYLVLLSRPPYHAMSAMDDPYIEPFLLDEKFLLSTVAQLQHSSDEYVREFVARARIGLGQSEHRKDLIQSAVPVLRNSLKAAIADEMRTEEVPVIRSWLAKAVYLLGDTQEGVGLFIENYVTV